MRSYSYQAQFFLELCTSLLAFAGILTILAIIWILALIFTSSYSRACDGIVETNEPYFELLCNFIISQLRHGCSADTQLARAAKGPFNRHSLLAIRRPRAGHPIGFAGRPVAVPLLPEPLKT